MPSGCVVMSLSAIRPFAQPFRLPHQANFPATPKPSFMQILHSEENRCHAQEPHIKSPKLHPICHSIQPQQITDSITFSSPLCSMTPTSHRFFHFRSLSLLHDFNLYQQNPVVSMRFLFTVRSVTPQHRQEPLTIPSPPENSGLPVLHCPLASTRLLDHSLC